MSHDEAKLLLIAALAEKTGTTPDSVAHELELAGTECPFDSVWLVSAGAQAATQMGVQLKDVRKHAPAFKSVDALTGYLHALALDQGRA